MGRNMTDVSGIDPTQDALARWLAANVKTMATAPGAGPRMFRGASNWLTGAPSVPEVSSTIAGGSPYGVSPVGVPGARGTPGGPAFRSMSRDTAAGGFPGILEFPNGAPLPQPRPADLGADNPQAPGARATGPSSSNQPGGITGPLNPWPTLKRGVLAACPRALSAI